MNRDSEQTVNAKNMDIGPTIGDMRLSRLSHPRASLMAMVLLAVVFLLFGLFASAAEASYAPAPNTVGGAMGLISDWVVNHCGITS